MNGGTFMDGTMLLKTRILRRLARFKKGSGALVRSTLRAVPAQVPDPFMSLAKKLIFRRESLKAKRFFICGCQRSGTTLMRLILDSHPRIHCFDEYKSYRALESGDYYNPKGAKFLGFKVPLWTNLFVDNPAYRQYYANEPVLFMMRDARATLASMLTLKTAEGTMFQDVLSAIEQRRPERPPLEFSNLFKDELDAVEQLPESAYRKVALFWRYKVSKYFDMARLGWPVLPIRYEALVLRPECHLRQIVNFLKLDWHENLLRHDVLEHDEVIDGFAVGRTIVRRTIDTRSLQRWPRILTPEQEKAILETVGEWNDFVANEKH